MNEENVKNKVIIPFLNSIGFKEANLSYEDSLTRIVVLYTKLGKNKEDISEILGMKENEIESILNNALETGMIKNNELQGVNLLDAEIENKQLDFEEK